MNATPSLTRQMARTVLAADFKPAFLALRPPARAKARLCLADYLSCIFEARALPWSQQAKALATPLPHGCTILASSLKATATEAAFANAVMAHGLVREDMHAASNTHHGVVVWSTLLALAETRPVTGGEILDAAILAYEAGARLGRVLFDQELARLFRPTGLTTPFGASLGAAYMLGLTEDQIVSALGLAANQAGGLNQWPHSGSSDMYFHPGFAARSALTAVRLAQAGAQASEAILEGEAGLFASFARRPAPATLPLFPKGEADILNVYHKPAPACNYAQTASQCALALLQSHAIAVQDITSIAIRVSDAALNYPGCNAKGPFERALQAKMSIIFATAAVLVTGRIAEESYHQLDHPDINRLIRVTDLQSAAHYTQAFPAKQGTSLSITLADGRILAIDQEDVVPANAALIEQRLSQAVTETCGAAQAAQLLSVLDQIEKLEDVRLLIDLCRTPAA